MKSIMTFPERGQWGNSQWRGNCSGHVQKELINFFKPSLFVDICEGSRTSRDVCAEMNVEYVGLDIHTGFDYTHDFVLEKLPRAADLVFSHPPYHDMILYSDNPNDTSRCSSIDEYLSKTQVMLFNMREATENNNVYCTLIGDLIKNGVCNSFQADLIKMMPRDELFRVMIKAQHNYQSANKVYSSSFIEVVHEYLLIWKKKPKNYWEVCVEITQNADNFIASSWRNLVRIVMMKTRKASLGMIYLEVTKIATKQIANNQHWKAKIRQILQKYHHQVERGIWAI